MFPFNDEFFEVEYGNDWPQVEEDSIQQIEPPQQVNSRYENRPLSWYDDYTTEQLRQYRDRARDPLLIEQYNRVIEQRERLQQRRIEESIVPPQVENDSDEIVPPQVEIDSDEIVPPEESNSTYINRSLSWYDQFSTARLRQFRNSVRDPYLREQYDRVIAQRERVEDDDNTRELPQQNNEQEQQDNVVRIDDDDNEDNMLVRLADSNRNRDFFGVIFEIDENNVEDIAAELAREAFLRPYRVNMPLFLVVRLRNQMDGSVRFYAVRYGLSNLLFLLRAIREPWFAWEHWRNTNNDYESDLPQKIFVSRQEYRTVDNAGMRPGVWITTHIGFYNPEFIPMPFNSSFDNNQVRNLWNLLARPNQGYLRRAGRFMRYSLNYDKVLLTDTPISKFWRTVKIQEEMAEKFQIPWFIHDDLLSEPEEGSLPCTNPIFALPCFLYALKSQIPTGIFEQIKNSDLILGVGVKTSVFSKLYEKFKIEFRVKRIWKDTNSNNFKVNTDILPKIRKEPAIYVVKMLLWEEHYMADAEYEIDGKMINFIRILEESKNQGLLNPINAFEFSRLYDNYSFDEMINFNYKYFIENTPRKYEFTESNYDKLIYKEKTGIPDIWFADFEATTDEEYHKPYLIVAKGFKVKIKDEKMIYEPIKTIIIDDFLPGPKDCAYKFLVKLTETYEHNSLKNKHKTTCRVYFHNLHYDFTFILQYLKETKLIMKGNKLYSAKGKFSYYGKEIKVDFWDSLPIFQCTLKQAAETYLTSEQKETIRKEIFPYDLYTFWNFATYDHYECPIQLALANLKIEDHEEFLRILNSDKKRFLTEDGNFAYKEYAIFYCEQDVNCLMWAMRNFADLLFGKSIEGVKGTPPFSLILWQYRTASSIGYEYFMRSVMLKKENDEYIPRYDWCIPKCELRALIQMSIRGGRVMVRDNSKFHWVAMHPGEYIQDYDFVSLYPTAMSKLWITDGSPVFLKAFDKDDKNYYTDLEFATHFRRPEDDDNTEMKFSDGIIHVIKIWTNKKLHFPLLCVKDKTTKLNNYQNFDGEDVDIWVNAIDLFNLIDFQRANFYWDAAIIWTGERRFEIRESIEKLFMFRAENKKHPVQLVTKLMLNSIFGKSILKPTGKQKLIVDKFRWRKNENGGWEKVNNFEEFFNANSYRINKIEVFPYDKVEVEIFKRDVSSSLNIFGSNVLAMARRIIGRVMAMAEDLEEKHFGGRPNIFYTDTDSMHITTQLLNILEDEYEKKYNVSLKGRNMGNCHEDFDLPSNFKPDEYVLGADESYFLMKKVYMDKLIGSQGSVAYHLRMKGIPTDLVHPEDYEKIYNGEDVEFDLLNGHTRFFYKNGHVGSRLEFKRKIGLKRKNNE